MPTTEKMVTSDRIQDTLYAFMHSQILFTAIDLDLFSLIARGISSLPALLDELNVDERGLRLLLNGLVGIGFLEVAGQDVYRLPEDAAKFLVRGTGSYLGGMVHHCKRLYENWSMLTDAVGSGQPVGGAQSLAQLEDYFAELVKGLYVSNYPTAQKLARLLSESGSQPSQVLDVAGGSAVWSIALLEQYPEARATVIDFPSVTRVAEQYISKHGLIPRFTYQPGDLEEMDIPRNHFDLVIMANICHTLGAVSSEKAIRKLATTIRPGGRLVIVDFVPDDRRSKPGWPMVFGVNMLITTPEGNVFTGKEYETWLHEAGFQTVSLHEIESEVTAIVAQI